jgi:hypothetical protein
VEPAVVGSPQGWAVVADSLPDRNTPFGAAGSLQGLDALVGADSLPDQNSQFEVVGPLPDQAAAAGSLQGRTVVADLHRWSAPHMNEMEALPWTDSQRLHDR